MIRAFALSMTLLAVPAHALQPMLHDQALEILPTGDRVVVLRYLEPEIAALTYADVAGTLDTLCEIDGLEAWTVTDPHPDEIVIVLMDRPVRRGQTDPEAVQFISAYRTETGERCLWQ